MARGLVDRERAQIGLDLDPGDQRAVGLDDPGHARGNRLGALGVAPQRVFGHATLAAHLQPPGQGSLRIGGAAGGVPVMRAHPELAARPLDDRRGLAPVVGVGMGADEQPNVLESEVDLVQRALQLGQRARLVHAGVDQDDPRTGGDGPGVAMRHSGPRQRQPQPPQPGYHPLSPPELALARHLQRTILGVAGRRRRVDCGPRHGRPSPRSPSGTSPRFRRTTWMPRVACWAPGSIDRLVGARELVAPDGIREYFTALFEAFPDFKLEVVDLTASRSRTAVRWRASGTFAGPGRFQGFVANHARIDIEGCDVLTVQDDLIRHNDAYLDSGDVARQLGLLPGGGVGGGGPADQARQPAHPSAHTDPRRAAGADRRWRVRRPRRLPGADHERLPDRGRRRGDDVRCGDRGHGRRGRWRPARGGAGSSASCSATPTPTIAARPPRSGAPVYCHPPERTAAESEDSLRDYWDLHKLDPHVRLLYRQAPTGVGRRRGPDRTAPCRRATRSPASGWSISPVTPPA